MSLEQDIQWERRFENYQMALNQLLKAAQLSSQRSLSDLEKQGMIQAFKFTHYEQLSNLMVDSILKNHIPCFIQLSQKMKGLAS